MCACVCVRFGLCYLKLPMEGLLNLRGTITKIGNLTLGLGVHPFIRR